MMKSLYLTFYTSFNLSHHNLQSALYRFYHITTSNTTSTATATANIPLPLPLTLPLKSGLQLVMDGSVPATEGAEGVDMSTNQSSQEANSGYMSSIFNTFAGGKKAAPVGGFMAAVSV
jgi:hypothetical protein